MNPGQAWDEGTKKRLIMAAGEAFAKELQGNK